MICNPSARTVSLQPAAALRAAQEVEAYFKASTPPRRTAVADLNALEAMYAYYSD